MKLATISKIALDFLILVCIPSCNQPSQEITGVDKAIFSECEGLFVGSMHAGALGDAMGRVTEFISSLDKIFDSYPQGVRSFNDFLPRDWDFIPNELKLKKIAPYTDDTRMAKLVLEVLIDARKQHWDLDTTMEKLAKSFVDDMHNITYGWAAPFRSPGNNSLRGVKKLDQLIKNHALHKKNWWQVGELSAGGCGSVMRAHPFGLIFADDPKKAAMWAAEHSKLTHGNSIALAACAAFAKGIAYTLQQKDPAWIIEQMIATARQYDYVTAEKMKHAYVLAVDAKKKRAQFENIYQALADKDFRSFHDNVFTTFEGWAAHDAIAATVYIFALSPDNVMEAIYLGVHTPGDSDSIASMAGALVGARVGSKQLPKDLINKLEDAEELQRNAKQAAVQVIAS